MSENRETLAPARAMLALMELDFDACYRALSARDARFDGRFFTGVKTTGIYCRPICPARTPKRENVTFYRSAAAAQEAGFRACLRCRPEVSPDLAAWNGDSSTVSRALKLIEDGGLDGANVEDLADRLGVGERHLRRLFKKHLGASPIAVAQTRRVLLAKQLIQETALSMTDVAMAAGFGSVRRFNETFQALYDRPPAQLRRTRRSELKAQGAADLRRGAAGKVTVRLPYRAPYDWDAMAAYFAGRATPGVETADERGYARTLEIDGARGVVRVRPAAKNMLEIEVALTGLSVLPKVIARVRRVFDLAADPETIGAHLAKDPALRPLVKKRPGLRLPGAWDGFELGVRAILGQQITVAAARNLAGVLSAAHGAPLDAELTGDEALSRLFPTPDAVATADLSSLPMPRARSGAIGSLAQAFLDAPDLFGLTVDLQDAVARLTALKGIGPWTAHYIAMRAFREPDAFPAADIGLMRALETPDGVRPTAAELTARAECWRPWRAYAAQHLWSADADAAQTNALNAAETKVAKSKNAKGKTSKRGRKNADQYAA